MLQNNLYKLYKSADANNMKFNANKCELVVKEQEIKSATPTNHIIFQTLMTKNKSEI